MTTTGDTPAAEPARETTAPNLDDAAALFAPEETATEIETLKTQVGALKSQLREHRRAPVSFQPENATEMWRLAQQLSASTIIPRDLRESPANVFAILIAGHELGLTPMQSVGHLHIIEGKIGSSALLQLARIQTSPSCEYFDLVESTRERAIYKTQRRRRDGSLGPEVTFEYSIDDAIEAGLVMYDEQKKIWLGRGRAGSWSPDGNWARRRKTMLRWRCVSELGRAQFADVLIGLPYNEDEIAEIRAFDDAVDITVTEVGDAGDEGGGTSRVEEMKAGLRKKRKRKGVEKTEVVEPPGECALCQAPIPPGATTCGPCASEAG